MYLTLILFHKYLPPFLPFSHFLSPPPIHRRQPPFFSLLISLPCSSSPTRKAAATDPLHGVLFPKREQAAASPSHDPAPTAPIPCSLSSPPQAAAVALPWTLPTSSSNTGAQQHLPRRGSTSGGLDVCFPARDPCTAPQRSSPPRSSLPLLQLQGRRSPLLPWRPASSPSAARGWPWRRPPVPWHCSSRRSSGRRPPYLLDRRTQRLLPMAPPPLLLSATDAHQVFDEMPQQSSTADHSPRYPVQAATHQVLDVLPQR